MINSFLLEFKALLLKFFEKTLFNFKSYLFPPRKQVYIMYLYVLIFLPCKNAHCNEKMLLEMVTFP